MNVLIDTSIWSLALRRQSSSSENPVVVEFKELIRESRVEMIGAIRQEILSGIKVRAQFETLRDQLRFYPDLPLIAADYEKAAEFFNINRQKGVQGSNTDFLICAVAHRYNLAVFTADKDFSHFQQHIPLVLHTPESREET